MNLIKQREEIIHDLLTGIAYRDPNALVAVVLEETNRSRGKWSPAQVADALLVLADGEDLIGTLEASLGFDFFNHRDGEDGTLTEAQGRVAR